MPRPGSPAGPLNTGDHSELRRELVRAVQCRCPAWLAANADDIVQTALIRVSGLRHNGSGEPRQLAPAYLKRAAYFALVDEIRRLRRLQEVPIVDDGEQVQFETNAPDPERSAASREIESGILECLRGLKKARRLTVTLYLQGHTVPEASRILGWSRKACENLLYRGLAELRQCLTLKGLTP